MKLNENLKSLLALFTRHAPTGAILLDFIKRQDEYLVLYRHDGNVCTPYIVHHLNSNGLYYGRYYSDEKLARMEFNEMK